MIDTFTAFPGELLFSFTKGSREVPEWRPRFHQWRFGRKFRRGQVFFAPSSGGRDFHYLDYGRMGRTDGHFGHQSLLQRMVFFKNSAPTVGLFIMEYAP